MAIIDNLEGMLANGQDSVVLRFSLGNEYLKAGRHGEAASQLRRAVELDPEYSAAWKLLGRALAESGEPTAAIQAYERGIAAADAKGDKQAAKEMAVFLKRLKKQ